MQGFDFRTKLYCHPESVENKPDRSSFQAVQDLTGYKSYSLIGKMLKYAWFNVLLKNKCLILPAIQHDSPVGWVQPNK